MKLLAFVVSFLVVAASFVGTVQASEVEPHHGHGSFTLCATLCETPTRRERATDREQTNKRSKRVYREVSSDEYVNQSDNISLQHVYRLLIDKGSTYKRISVYLN